MDKKEDKKIRLLVLTQKLDKNDDLLGFMHGWITEFAKHFESIMVIALSVGEYNLPKNVKVVSLGKGKLKIAKKFIYLINFYRYIWRYRNEYDWVFVHMNKEYMLLGGLFWRLWGKKTALWYNHVKGNIFSILAGCLAQKIFYTSPFSFFAKWPKAQIMPAGIDTEIFRKNEDIQPIKNSILYLGRLSPIKNVHILIEAAKLLEKEGVDFILNIVGEAGEKDKEYFNKLKDSASNLERKGKIKFWGKMPNYKTPEIYNKNEIIINLTNSGSLDKVILEAMACERLVLVCNAAFNDIFPDDLKGRLIFQEKNSSDLSEKLSWLTSLNQVEREVIGRRLRAVIIEKHSLEQLVARLSEIFESLN